MYNTLGIGNMYVYIILYTYIYCYIACITEQTEYLICSSWFTNTRNVHFSQTLQKGYALFERMRELERMEFQESM